MKILQVTPYFPPHFGGLEKCVYEISQQLANRGHQVLIYTTRTLGTKKHEMAPKGVVIYRLPILFTLFDVVPVSLFYELLKENTEIIHVHIPPPTGMFSSMLLGKIRKKPVVLTYHNDTVGNGFFENIVAKIYNIFLYKFLFKHVSIIIVPSKAYKSKLIVAGIDCNKIKVIQHGISMMHTNSASSEIELIRNKHGLLRQEKIVLFVGALEMRKGAEYLIKAVPKVIRTIKNVRFIIVGEGSQRSKLAMLAKQLGVSSYVIFTGQIHDNEKHVLYDVANVFVLPSLYETFGLVLLEAMNHHKPIVSTRIAGTSQLLRENHNCVLVEPRDSGQLAEAIVMLLTNHLFTIKLVENAKRIVSKYSWENTVSRLIEVYNDVRHGMEK